MSEIFPNSKPKIFGEDTHAASLTGDAGTDTHAASLTGSPGTDTHAASLTGDSSIDEDNVSTGIIGLSTDDWPVNTFNPSETEAVTRTLTINATTIKNILFVHASGIIATNGTDRGVTFRLRLNGLGGTILDSITIATSGITAGNTFAQEFHLRSVESGIPADTTSVVLTQQHVGSASISGEKWSGQFVWDAYYAEVNDTHAASLTGSPGTDTHAAELIGDAGTDTHAAELIGDNTQRTHETEVIR